MLCSAAYVEGASKHDFLQNRSSKGLLYYYNATGNADYDKGGDHYDVLRVFMDDITYDLDERIPLLRMGK